MKLTKRKRAVQKEEIEKAIRLLGGRKKFATLLGRQMKTEISKQNVYDYINDGVAPLVALAVRDMLGKKIDLCNMSPDIYNRDKVKPV